VDRVPIATGRTLFQRQAACGGGIADVHGVPPVRAVSGIAGEAFLLCDRDQLPEEAGTVSCAVCDERQPHDRRSDSLLGEADDGAFHNVTNTQGARGARWPGCAHHLVDADVARNVRWL
jgi:hypothetical protein